MFARTLLLRRFATAVDPRVVYSGQIKELLKHSIKNFRSKIKKNNPDAFTYDVIKNKYNTDFLKTNNSILTRAVSSLENDILSWNNEHVQVDDIKKPKVLETLFMPTTKNIYYLSAYLLSDSPNDLSALPVKVTKGASKEDQRQEIMDLVIEKLMYMKFKSYHLQYIFNDKGNTQNYNENLTMNIMDVDNPCEWFPQARKIKRKFIMHVGPTNSGKTYNALKRLETCSKGYFAGPLRLLAREVYEKFQERGVRCNLVTGEEVVVDIDENGNRAGLTSGTIEMLSLSDTYDVVVVDEIQMIGDEFRGSAWTNAILGAKAKEIHLCGEKSAVPLIKKLVQMTGDDLVINEYNRLGKLVVDDEPVTLQDLKKGDCIVCFSKPIILDMKAHVEKQTGLRCAVIYGALPPETRAQEAQRFNNGEYDVVVASDAIGMGLNLKINRVIFTTTQKYNGKMNITLSDSNIKQIGGRAGRFGVGESEGHITAISKDELNVVKKAIDAPISYLEKATLWPPDGLWVRYYSMFTENTTLTTMYRKFETDLSRHFRRTKHIKRDFALQALDDRKIMSKFFDDKGLNRKFYIQDQLKCVSCPSTITGAPSRALKLVTDDLFEQFMQIIIQRSRKSIFDFESMPFYLIAGESVKDEPIQNKKVNITDNEIEPEPVPAKLKKQMVENIKKAELEEFQTLRKPVKQIIPVEERLMKLEQFHRATGTYMWLAYRFPQCFIDIQSATKLRELIEYRISEMLSNLRATQKLNKKRFKTF